MRNLLILLSAFNLFVSAHAEDLFLDVPIDKQQEIIDGNFDEYHDTVFNALPGRYRIALLNDDAMDKDEKEIEFRLFDDLLPISVKNKGISQKDRGSEYGRWTGLIRSNQDINTIDLVSGKVSKEIVLNIKLQYLDVISGQYRNAHGLFRIKMDYKKSSQEGFMGPVPPNSKFVYRVIVTDVYLNDLVNGQIPYRVQSFQNNPDYVLITVPDPEKDFGLLEGDIDSVTATKLEQYRDDYKKYKDKVKKEKEDKQ